ncbi:hypothetical protein SAMD00023353_2901160 [Rosellinia necatrix]|uniref:Uncharacterized protein n=1 Tax=Rosellinia necatrix TaxID=77044 RepID=A0A1W2TJN2_ROSNE|nr:hypothetical protein SAMD00023353_2901160 [Rosellinia necatrix]
MWRPCDPLPPAWEPCKDDQEEWKYDQALQDPNRCFGQGIASDPLVVWLDRRPRMRDRELVWAHNNFAKAIAKALGLTHAWVVRAAHAQQYARDAQGRKILIESPDRYLLVEADMHITLRFGSGLYECRLSAHAYVVLDGRGRPERYMTELVRRFRTGGGIGDDDGDDDGGKGKVGHPQLEFWPWYTPHRRSLPRRPVDLGPGWQAHANVGPYLDTYRPDARRIGDTYTPRSADKPPREPVFVDEKDDEDDENDNCGVIEGAITPELMALVQRCNAAYTEYQAFLQCLIQMDYPPAENMTELRAMGEQVVTMQREICREAMAAVV